MPRGLPFTGADDPRRSNGKPKGLSSWIRERTNGGLELAEFFLSVARGEPQRVPETVKLGGVEYEVIVEGGPRVVVPDLETRLSCARWLSDRYFGKVPEKVALTDSEGNDVFDPRQLDDRGLAGLTAVVAAIAERPAKALPVEAGDRGGDAEAELLEVHPGGVADR